MNGLICSAIADRKYLTFCYDKRYRSVEPHCHGVSAAGDEVLWAYQVEGYAPPEKPQDWKLFEVARIERVQKLDATFPAARPDYSPEDPAMAEVCCHVTSRFFPAGPKPPPGGAAARLRGMGGKADETTTGPSGEEGSDRWA